MLVRMLSLHSKPNSSEPVVVPWARVVEASVCVAAFKGVWAAHAPQLVTNVVDRIITLVTVRRRP